MSVQANLQSLLSHVLWIGGPPDSGKTTIAQRLAGKYGLQVYHFDRHEPAHFARADPERHPALYAARPDRMTDEERWLGSPPAVMARETIACWTERFAMALDDLLAMPYISGTVAEGPGLFPECVQPLISAPRRAVWLVPSEDLKRAIALARGKPGTRDNTSDPERATENLIQRDLLMARHIEQGAGELGLTVIAVDGSEEVDQVAGRVERHFAPFLPGRS